MGLGIFSWKSADDVRSGATSKFVPADASAQLAEDPAIRALQLGRYGLLAANADRAAESPSYQKVLDAALKAIDERFAIVPEGYVSVAMNLNEDGGAELDCETQPFLLALHCVTNAEYQKFVDDGGYQQAELWPEEVWPHLIDFKDQSGKPGPRYWRDGRHDKRLAKHPVVGISYFEAVAFTSWAGYRLPTEAEWQMAASWQLRSAANVTRRYPWGDALDLDNCNIWSSGHAGTLPVDACPGGAAPNGVVQLIGNVWEWTSSDFACTDSSGRQVVGDMLMKVIRGGAFDTYFPWQATSTFRTGVPCLGRTNNTGFRCAMDVLD